MWERGAARGAGAAALGGAGGRRAGPLAAEQRSAVSRAAGTTRARGPRRGAAPAPNMLKNSSSSPKMMNLVINFVNESFNNFERFIPICF